jgi:hypothetical protein
VGIYRHSFIHSDSKSRPAGDTGLLDHLLKHLADKVVTAEGDKLRRRHNAEGHMEYWLQSAADTAAGERSHKHSTRLCLVVRADDAVAYGCAVGSEGGPA